MYGKLQIGAFNTYAYKFFWNLHLCAENLPMFANTSTVEVLQ